MHTESSAQCLHRGFTLLEVLIALLVLALALTALTRTVGNTVNTFGTLRERTLANWVAANVLAETRLHEPFPDPGKRDGERMFANRHWYWELVIQPTEELRIRRLDVRVFAASDRKFMLVQLTGFSGLDLQP